jgi:hypothetical protein
MIKGFWWDFVFLCYEPYPEGYGQKFCILEMGGEDFTTEGTESKTQRALRGRQGVETGGWEGRRKEADGRKKDRRTKDWNAGSCRN